MKSKLKQNYQKYRKQARKGKPQVSFLRNFMSEIIFRTTKLEGESVTRKMVKSIVR